MQFCIQAFSSSPICRSESNRIYGQLRKSRQTYLSFYGRPHYKWTNAYSQFTQFYIGTFAGYSIVCCSSQTNSTPISLDAIEEIQVNISPYTLKDAGFTGASINAVTRSGTNTFHGSGFYNFGRQSR